MLEGREKLPNSEKYLFRDLKFINFTRDPLEQFSQITIELDGLKRGFYNLSAVLSNSEVSDRVNEFFNFREGEKWKWMWISKNKVNKDLIPAWVSSLDSNNSPDYFELDYSTVLIGY